MHRVLLAFAVTLAAASAQPAWVGELTPSAFGPHPRLQPVRLDYQVSWKGAIDSGRISLSFGPRNTGKAGMFVVRSQAASQGAAAALFPYTHSFWSELHQDTLRPRLFHSIEADARESATTVTRYQPAQVDVSEATTVAKTGVTTADSAVFKFPQVHDIFSALLFVRSQRLANGDKVALVVMPFKTPYLLRATVLGRENHNGRASIKLSAEMRKIDRDTLELRAYKKLNRAADLWLSDDADRFPLELRADVFIGDVRATLANSAKL